MLFIVAASEPKEEHTKVNNKTHHIGEVFICSAGLFHT